MLSAEDQEWAERVLNCIILPRNVFVEDLREICDLVIKLKTDFSHAPQFIVLNTDLKQFLDDFTVEQATIMDALVSAGRDEEYSMRHASLSHEVKPAKLFCSFGCARVNNRETSKSNGPFKYSFGSHIFTVIFYNGLHFETNSMHWLTSMFLLHQSRNFII